MLFIASHLSPSSRGMVTHSHVTAPWSRAASLEVGPRGRVFWNHKQPLSPPGHLALGSHSREPFPKSVVLDERRFCAPGNIWQFLGTFLVFHNLGGGYWHLTGGGRGCGQTSCRAQDGFPAEVIRAPHVSSAEEGGLGAGVVHVGRPDQRFQLDLGTRSTCKSPARAPP